MTAVELVKLAISALDRLMIPYMVVGSFSSNVYGNPRSTKDADFVLELGSTPISAVMCELGSEFEIEQQMSFETVTATTRHRIRHRETSFLIEFFLLSDDPHDRLRFHRRVSGDIGEQRAFVPTAEDVVIQKLRWSKHGRRQKDIDDAAGVIAVQSSQLDLEYIRKWCDEHETRELLEKLLTDSTLRSQGEP